MSFSPWRSRRAQRRIPPVCYTRLNRYRDRVTLSLDPIRVMQVTDPPWLTSLWHRPRRQSALILARYRRTRTGWSTSPQGCQGLLNLRRTESLAQQFAQLGGPQGAKCFTGDRRNSEDLCRKGRISSLGLVIPIQGLEQRGKRARDSRSSSRIVEPY